MRRFFLLYAVFCLSVLSAQPLNVKVKAKSAILYNPETQEILFQKNAQEPHYPASTLKIATALYALEQKIDLGKSFRASEGALEVVNAEEKQANFCRFAPYILEHDGVTVGVVEGKEYSFEALLHGLLLESGNDAANVIAEGIGETIPKFMEGLNLFLQKNGIYQTRFQNPHGLHHPAQMTTAYDMARIAGLAFQNPLFCKIVMEPTYWLEKGRLLSNTSRFLKEGKYRYAKYIGGKTGYIASAGYNLVAGAQQGDRKLVAVLLGAETSVERFEDAINLFEAAFREKKEKRLLFAKDHECFLHKDATCEKTFKAHLKENVEISYYPSEEPKLQAKLVWLKQKRSVLPGTVVGKLVVENAAGIVLTQAPLHAAHIWDRTNRSYWLFGLAGLCLVFFALFKKKGKLFKA